MCSMGEIDLGMGLSWLVKDDSKKYPEMVRFYV